MSPRVYVRKFDYEEARARYASGETTKALAQEYGVSVQRVWQIVRPGELERMREYKREWAARGRCDDCGGPMNNQSRVRGSRRCRDCAALASATSVRDNELRCIRCREWKADDAFPLNRAGTRARRGRHDNCRSCQTTIKREYRRKHREKANAYDREYKRRRKQVAA